MVLIIIHMSWSDARACLTNGEKKSQTKEMRIVNNIRVNYNTMYNDQLRKRNSNRTNLRAGIDECSRSPIIVYTLYTVTSTRRYTS